MCLVLLAKGLRGAACLEALIGAGYQPELIVLHPEYETGIEDVSSKMARRLGIRTIAPQSPNSPEFVRMIKQLKSRMLILAGYGKILQKNLLDVPRLGAINLHAGRLPQYRGSSPLNWALINGEHSITLSVIQVNEGIDTGDVLLERSHPVKVNDTIVDLHRIANRLFPELLLEVLERSKSEALTGREQDESEAGYFPVRFPKDGFIFWDLLTAEQVHNRIRALRPPYPGATTRFQGRVIKLISSALTATPYFGHPGRVYRTTGQRFLVCASDRCVWIDEAVFADNDAPVVEAVNRYDSLATLQRSVLDPIEARTACV